MVTLNSKQQILAALTAGVLIFIGNMVYTNESGKVEPINCTDNFGILSSKDYAFYCDRGELRYRLLTEDSCFEREYNTKEHDYFVAMQIADCFNQTDCKKSFDCNRFDVCTFPLIGVNSKNQQYIEAEYTFKFDGDKISILNITRNKSIKVGGGLE